jgi:hypothetical protein
MGSPKWDLSWTDIKKWLLNIIIFTSPVLAAFFGSLAAGSDWKVSAGIGMVALYQVVADLLKKLAADTRQ